MVVDGTRLPVPEMAAKVVAYVALRQWPVARRTFAGAVWPRAHDSGPTACCAPRCIGPRGSTASFVWFEMVALAPGVSGDTQLLLRAIGQLDAPYAVLP